MDLRNWKILAEWETGRICTFLIWGGEDVVVVALGVCVGWAWGFVVTFFGEDWVIVWIYE